jgi:hypothetical protein
MMSSFGFRRSPAQITVYRGQKSWHSGLVLTASSLRKAFGVRDPVQWTEGLLQIISGCVLGALAGVQDSRSQLEWQLLYSQQTAFQNPFVSCSFTQAVAVGFACADDTPGYVVTLEGDWHAGFDFEYVRRQFGLFPDAMDYLAEFGIPRSVAAPFTVVAVHHIDASTGMNSKVFP